ncbi:hypothetical protein JJB07_00535 [Tumebacillus sp. ITR2]|uniref:Uncharacterized protein n=1 Tax=Tumebacillus amylolyticus TaxID=2801339 RepID=A0ABS1J4G3_9BACL|nr:hypothetical protein [Tumebacillus amylolyticus]MBL0385117.1 hypothetical protein [Tumebacillus amylolyticus]
MQAVEAQRMELLTDMVAEAVFDLIVNDKLRLVGVGSDIWGIVPNGYGVYDIDRAEREYWELYEKFIREMEENAQWLKQEIATQEASWEVLNAA